MDGLRTLEYKHSDLFYCEGGVLSTEKTPKKFTADEPLPTQIVMYAITPDRPIYRTVSKDSWTLHG